MVGGRFKFDLLREATFRCMGQHDSYESDLIQFRYAATLITVSDLLNDHDELRELAARPVASHSLGVLDAQELELVTLFRAGNESSKRFVMRAAEVTNREEKSSKREVVSLTTRWTKG